MDDEIKIAVALDGKISQLVSLYENEKGKVLELKDKTARLEERVKSLETELSAQKEINRNLQLAAAFMSGEDASDAKRFIDDLVREIDECVTLLNR
jgi:polyhydroxyalkanoate synthesis regulator phasin